MSLPPPLPRSRGLSIAQLVVSILALVLSGISLVGLMAGMLILDASPDANQDQAQQFPFLIWIMVLLILLVIPSLIHARRGLSGIPSPQAGRHGFLFACLALMLFLALFLAGRQLAEQGTSGWLLAPLNLLMVLIPLWWLVELGRLQLTPESKQRRWGTMTLSVFVSLPVIMLVEIVVILTLLIIGSIWLIGQPQFAPILQQIGGDFVFDSLAGELPQIDFLPLLNKPEVIFAAFLGISLIIPMIEEALKPLAIWFLLKRRLTPADGFVVGMLCGAAFALVESAFSLSTAGGMDWGFTVLGRAGTGLLHVFTAGLNGWALAAAWQDARHIRQGMVYALTVLIHGIWNFFAVFLGIAQVGVDFPLPADPLLTRLAPWILSVMAGLMVAALFSMNRSLERSQKGRGTPPALPPALPYAEMG